MQTVATLQHRLDWWPVHRNVSCVTRMFSIYSCMRFIFVLPSLGTRPTNRFETEQATNTDEAQLCIRHNTVKTDNIYSSNYMQDTTHINIPVYK